MGGRSQTPELQIISTIAEYNEADQEWTNRGSLQQQRFGHSAIVNNNYIMVFGGIEKGPGEVKSEKCVILEEIYCSVQEPTLRTEGVSNGFWSYPEVFNIND